jgi:DNA polymerase-3 subunit beta
MITNVNRASLASALATVTPATSRRSSVVPILGNVLLDARADGLWLTCTNDIRVTRRIDAEPGELGATTVPASELRRMVGYLDADEVELSTPRGRDTLTVKAGSRTLRLRGLSAEEFPDRLPIAEPVAISLDRRELRDALRRLAVAISWDGSRPALSGILFKLVGSELVLAAADGFRLHVDRLAVESPVEFDFILPGDAVRHLVRLLAGAGDVKLVIGQKSTVGQDVRFDLGDTALTSYTVQADFPNYEALVPKSHETRVTVDRRKLLMATRLASVVAKDANNIVGIHLVDSHLVVSAKANDVGEVTDEIPAEIDGPLMPVALNFVYLSEALSALHADVVVLDLATPARPILIGGPHVAFQAVVMPMHTLATNEYERELKQRERELKAREVVAA